MTLYESWNSKLLWDGCPARAWLQLVVLIVGSLPSVREYVLSLDIQNAKLAERYRMVSCYIVLAIHYHYCVHLHFNSGITEKHRRVEAPEGEFVSTAQITFQHDENYLRPQEN